MGTDIRNLHRADFAKGFRFLTESIQYRFSSGKSTNCPNRRNMAEPAVHFGYDARFSRRQ
jgi:hypothetical protein